MTNTTQTTTAATDGAAPLADYPYRWEFQVSFDRALDHRCDDPEQLESLLGRLGRYRRTLGLSSQSDDLKVTVTAFDPEVGATIVLGAETLADKPPVVPKVRQAVHNAATLAYRELTAGETPPPALATAVQRIENDEDPPTRGSQGPNSPVMKKRRRAEAWLEDHDTVDAPRLGVDVTARTLAGAVPDAEGREQPTDTDATHNDAVEASGGD